METFILQLNSKKETSKMEIFGGNKNLDFYLNCVFGVSNVWFILLRFDYFNFFWTYLAPFSFYKRTTNLISIYLYLFCRKNQKYLPLHFCCLICYKKKLLIKKFFLHYIGWINLCARVNRNLQNHIKKMFNVLVNIPLIWTF